MKTAIPELMSATAFEPKDLDVMQAIFLQACAERNAHHPEHRAAIATVILDAYAQGERDPKKLLDAAMAAAL